MKKVFMLLIVCILGCAHCGPQENPPYVRTQPGIEYCGAMCDKFIELNCTGYYEDIEIDCQSDPVYQTMEQCANDAGIVMLNCTDFCEYEMNNSVQLNPECLSKTLTKCEDIETICL